MSHDEQARQTEVAATVSGAAKQPWTPPAVADLPRLTDLTLQGHYGGEIIGEPVEGGESVFPSFGL